MPNFAGRFIAQAVQHGCAPRMPNAAGPSATTHRPLEHPNRLTVTISIAHAVRNGGPAEHTSNILTVKEVSTILRCSKTHVLNALEGKVRGLPKLTHFSLGRRKVVRRDWLDQWMEDNRTR